MKFTTIILKDNIKLLINVVDVQKQNKSNKLMIYAIVMNVHG